MDAAEYLSLVQIVCFWIGFMITRASESRKRFYNKVMPEITHWCIYTATLIIPAMIATFDIISMVTSKLDDVVLMHFILQIGIVIWFLVDWRAIV